MGKRSHADPVQGRQNHVSRKLAVDYYFSKARYSPASGKRRHHPGNVGQQKVGFGSSALRWPVQEDSRSTPHGGIGDNRRKDSGTFRAQPFSDNRPTVPSYLPSFQMGKEDHGGGGGGIWKRDTLSHRTEALPGKGDSGWSFPPVPRRPTVVPGPTYHSAVSSTKRANIHGRTDWTAK